MPKRKFGDSYDYFRAAAAASRAHISDTRHDYRLLFEMATATNVVHACAEFGVSTTTYYKWLHRFIETGELKDHSRRRAAARPKAADARPNYKRLFELVDSGNISITQACRSLKISRTAYYKWRPRYDAGASLKPRRTTPRRQPSKLDISTLRALRSLATRHPNWGSRRLATELVRHGLRVSASSVQRRLEAWRLRQKARGQS